MREQGGSAIYRVVQFQHGQTTFVRAIAIILFMPMILPGITDSALETTLPDALAVSIFSEFLSPLAS